MLDTKGLRSDTVFIGLIDAGDRFRKDLGDLTELKASIQREGLLHPVVLIEADEGRYQLAAGGRRLRAYVELGIDTIPARIFPATDDELDLRAVELAENIHRKVLSYAEEVASKQRIHDLQVERHGKGHSGPSGGWSLRDTARLLGEAVGTTSGDLNLARAIQEMPELGGMKNKHEAQKAFAGLREELVKEEMAKRADASMPDRKQALAKAYIVGDFFEVVKNVPDASVDLCEVDPPYGILFKSRRTPSDQQAAFGDMTDDEFSILVTRVSSECFRILRDGGWIVFWSGFQRIHLAAQALKAAGFSSAKYAVWAKSPAGGANLDVTLSSAFESFVYTHKGRGHIVSVGRSNVFDFKIRLPHQSHAAQKPVELMQEILSTFCHPGATIMVPFLGSGDTLLAAANLSMHGFGCDLEKRYRDAFIAWVEQGEVPYRSVE